MKIFKLGSGNHHQEIVLCDFSNSHPIMYKSAGQSVMQQIHMKIYRLECSQTILRSYIWQNCARLKSWSAIHCLSELYPSVLRLWRALTLLVRVEHVLTKLIEDLLLDGLQGDGRQTTRRAGHARGRGGAGQGDNRGWGGHRAAACCKYITVAAPAATLILTCTYK